MNAFFRYFVTICLKEAFPYHIHHEISQLEMSIYHPVGIKVLVVFAERIEKSLRHLEPTDVEQKLETRKDRKDIVYFDIVSGNVTSRIEPLAAEETRSEERVDGHGDNLEEREVEDVAEIILDFD